MQLTNWNGNGIGAQWNLVCAVTEIERRERVVVWWETRRRGDGPWWRQGLTEGEGEEEGGGEEGGGVGCGGRQKGCGGGFWFGVVGTGEGGEEEEGEEEKREGVRVVRRRWGSGGWVGGGATVLVVVMAGWRWVWWPAKGVRRRVLVWRGGDRGGRGRRERRREEGEVRVVWRWWGSGGWVGGGATVWVVVMAGWLMGGEEGEEALRGCGGEKGRRWN
nr:uncharacterized protein LOC112721630 [Arachis hypogaea]